MTNTENDPATFPRDHSHCMDRTGINYVPCTSLTHCPSICDCPVDACTAETQSEPEQLDGTTQLDEWFTGGTDRPAPVPYHDTRESLASLMARTPLDFWALTIETRADAEGWRQYTDEQGDTWTTNSRY